MTDNSSVTRAIADAAARVDARTLAPDIPRWVRHCVLDWLAVTIAGAKEPAASILWDELSAEDHGGACTAVGRAGRLSAHAAALLNGTASHALDYDDVNLALPGHPSVAIVPGLLALAETQGSSGAEFMAAFVAGYDAACHVGALLSPGHYAAGFHPTGTLGAIGAAAACSHLLRLPADVAATALGIAATQAAGLKAQFGTMCKPLHAGQAASNGLRAARLASRGFSGRADIIECGQGFASTHSPNFDPTRFSLNAEPGTWLRSNLFKYHAACYLTHAAMNAMGDVRRTHGVDADAIEQIDLLVHESCATVCDIAEPRTGLEAKFSLRHTLAMAACGDDTSALETFSDALAVRPDLVALRRRVRVQFTSTGSMTAARLLVTLNDGARIAADSDSGQPETDLDLQEERLLRKFCVLTSPALGEQRSTYVAELALSLEGLSEIGALARATQ